MRPVALLLLLLLGTAALPPCIDVENKEITIGTFLVCWHIWPPTSSDL